MCAFINSLQTCLLTFVYQAPCQIAEMPTRQHGEVRTTWMGIQDTWDTVGDLAGNSSNEESQVEGFLAWPRGAERARGPHRRWRGTHGLATAGTVTIPKAKETGGTGESCNPGGGTGPREVTELPSETGCQNGAGGREQPSLAVRPLLLEEGLPLANPRREVRRCRYGAWSPGAERAEKLGDGTLMGGGGRNQKSQPSLAWLCPQVTCFHGQDLHSPEVLFSSPKNELGNQNRPGRG